MRINFARLSRVKILVDSNRDFYIGKYKERYNTFIVIMKKISGEKEHKIDKALISEEGLKRFLSSSFIKGIGPVYADKIVGRLGTDILNPEFDPEAGLSDVPGLGENKIEELKRSMEELKYPANILALLYSSGLSDVEVEKIASHYKRKLTFAILDDPYDMVENAWKVSFFTADKIGHRVGIKEDDPRRLRGALLTAVKFYAERGNMYATAEQAVKTASAICNVNEEEISKEIPVLVEEGRLVKSREGLYLPVFYEAEKEAANKLSKMICNREHYDDIFDMPTTDISGNPLNKDQKKAIHTVMSNPVTIITGGPGTGKTTAIRGLIRLFEDMDKKVVLAAPTGRAAKRMTDLSGFEAKTFHRLLGYSMGRGYRNKKFDADILIIDEASMLEQVMFRHLLDAIDEKAKIVLLGDTNQLPSIGAGDVLNQLIQSGTIPVINLRENFRQKSGSLIAANAENVKAGIIPDSTDDKRDFILMKEKNDGSIRSKLLRLVKEEIPAICHVDPKDIQVVTPQQEGPLGAKELNIVIQEAVNPDSPEIKRGMKRFRLGDRVMQTANSAEQKVYNGETGWISNLDPEKQIFEVTFYDGKKLFYDKSRFKELTLAYATTVHKLQGSETDYMVLVLASSHRPLLYRNLLYTGISRAKKLCVLVSEGKALETAVSNASPAIRNSHFKERLQNNLLQPLKKD